jgi:hypothetical protein
VTPKKSDDETPKESGTATAVPRKPYERPRLRKHGPVEKVTLFSAGGVPAGGLTASGAPGQFPQEEP